MSRTKRLYTLRISIIMLVVLFGCAAPQPNPSTASPESLRPGFDIVYYPAIQPGMTSDSAKQDWITLFPGSAFFDNRIEMQISQSH